MGCDAVALAEFLAVEWTALRLEAAARAFDVVNDRFDCDCARALKALLAWWLPDRSIVCMCVEEWRWSQGGRRKREDWTKTARQAQVCPAGEGNWKACDVFINVEERQWQLAAVATDGG